MRSKCASPIPTVHSILGILALHALGVLALTAASFLISGRAVAGCDLTRHLAKLNSAKALAAGVEVRTPGAAAAFSGPQNRAITGYWLAVTVDGQGNVVDERFDNWFDDHNEVFVDQSPPPTGNVCNGTWVQTGSHEFKLLHKAWVFDSTNTIVIATVAIRDAITLSENKESFSGTETFTEYDLNGNVLGTFGPFDLQGTRLKVDF